jgi:CO dehydrogenase maturation factor
MKIAFVGKGGSGKTTLAALLVGHLVAEGHPVLAVDADINQHLAVALGADDAEAAGLPALGEHLDLVKDYLRGSNPRIRSTASMIKTTPPGAGSRLLRVVEDNPLYDRCVRRVGPSGIRLAVTGPFSADDLGVACYHSKVGAVELLLNHLVDGPGEYVVVDMTAGADSFASGMFTRFDVTFVVCEPTLRSVGVHRQYVDHAAGFDVSIAAVGNKVADGDDLAFLQEQLGDALLAHLTRSDHVRAAERGDVRPVGDLEPGNRDALDALRRRADAATKDWAAYHRQAVEFHLRNAASWGNARTGEDLATQVDPDFVAGPTALAEPGRPLVAD